MVHHQSRRAARLAETLEHVDNIETRGLVERGGWLIGEDDFGITHQGACDGDALLLAPGEMLRQIIQLIAKTKKAQDVRRIGSPVRHRLWSVKLHSHPDVLNRRQVVMQIVGMKKNPSWRRQAVSMDSGAPLSSSPSS